MSWILEAAVSNALFATAISVVVVAVSRFWRHRPAVIHAMWLIVLLKLVTPPLLNCPLSFDWGSRIASVIAFQPTAVELPNALANSSGAEHGSSAAHGGHSDSEDSPLLRAAHRLPTKSGIDSGGSLKRRCEMILSDRSTFQIGRVTGLLLLLVAIGILPLAAMVRADDESGQENAAAPQQDEQARQLDDESRLAWWHKSPKWQAKDCAACHKVAAEQERLQEPPKPIGSSLDVWGRMTDLRRRRYQIEGARQRLKNLGFDDPLIETLIKDRAKAQHANQVL